MRIRFTRISDQRHELALLRDGVVRERVECETRSYLTHDLLHYAVEAEAGLAGGFWGNLAAGRTLAQMNDRTGGMGAGAADAEEMGTIEQVVGALTGAVKGRSAADMVSGMQRFAASAGTTMPGWLTEAFVVAVQERMRRLLGHWRATPVGHAMELDWDAPPQESQRAREKISPRESPLSRGRGGVR
jgi:hypothetical protein